MNATDLWQQFLVQTATRIDTRLEAMPRAKALAWGERLGRAGYALVKRSRTSAERNLRLAYGDMMTEAEREAMVQRVFIHFCKTCMDMLHTRSYTADQVASLVTEVEGWDEYAVPILAQGKGVMALSGHIGNWEFFARYVAQVRKVPMTVVVREPLNPTLGGYVRRLRENAGYAVTNKGESARRLLKVLKDNQMLAILPDQNHSDVFVPFFGVPAGTAAGPAYLALKTGAPLAAGYCLWKSDNTYKILVRPPIPVEDTGDRDADIARIMAAVNRDLEEVIRQYPDQWLWLHNRWKSVFDPANRALLPEGYDYTALEARWRGE
jgi:KDO2-lipid IV(A) lauroyltransferase